MDKQKVIEAYRRGLITLQECGQILGAEKEQLDKLVRVNHLRRPLSPKPYLTVDHHM
jgi:exonuclease VII small subunit